MNEHDSFLRKARKTGFEVDWSIGDYEIKFLTGSKLGKRRYQRNETQDNLANPKSF